MSTTCTCGETEPHVVARRETTDGLRVELWDNGAVTGGYGYLSIVLKGARFVRRMKGGLLCLR